VAVVKEHPKMVFDNLPTEITVNEQIVGEGLSSEENFVPTETKVWLIRELISAGCKSFQVSNFGNPKYMPNFRDCEELYAQIGHPDGVILQAPTLNMRALERIKELQKSGFGPNVAMVTIATTDTFNKLHTNRTTEETWKMVEPLVALCHDAGLTVAGGIGGVWTCMATGERIPSNIPFDVADRWIKLGVDSLIHGENGAGPEPAPTEVYDYFSRMLDKYPDPKMHSFHLHDGYGWGLTCFIAAMQAGITNFDTCLGGLQGGQGVPIMDNVPLVSADNRPSEYLGGPRTGLVCTEDFVTICDAMGIQTGMNINKIHNLGLWVERIVGRKLWSGYLRSMHFAGQEYKSG
jgi:hydroxymethylglutaryl-CoA lyase